MERRNYFSSNLKFLRKRKKHNQDFIAQQLGVQRATVGHYETGVIKNIPAAELIWLSNFFSVPADFLLKVDLQSLNEKQLTEIEESKNGVSKGGRPIQIVEAPPAPPPPPPGKTVVIKRDDFPEYVRTAGSAEFVGRLEKANLPFFPEAEQMRVFVFSESEILFCKRVPDWSAGMAEQQAVMVLTTGIELRRMSAKDGWLILSPSAPGQRPEIVSAEEIVEIWSCNYRLSPL